MSELPGLSSYRPGSWFAVLGARASVLLPPSEKHRVAALWELLDDGAGFDEVLDALLASGLRELPGFVLLSEDDGETRVVLRGAARATLVAGEEPVELAGSAATTWIERSLRGVTRTTLCVPDDDLPAGPDLRIGLGLVRVSRLDRPPYDEAGPPLEADEEAPAVADDAGVEPVPEDVDEDVDELSALVEPATEEEPAAEPAPVAEPEPEPVTGLAALGLGPRAPAPDTDHDGLTHLGDAPAPATPPPGIPGQPPAPDVTRPVAALAFSSGETVEVDRPVLVGRAPQDRGPAAQARLVSVPSPNQEISSTHLEVRPGSGADHGFAVATDLGSTNGTVLVQPGLPPEDLPAGVAVQLLPGAVLDLGDGLTISVNP